MQFKELYLEQDRSVKIILKKTYIKLVLRLTCALDFQKQNIKGKNDDILICLQNRGITYISDVIKE